MSDSTESGREWRFSVEDMIAFASKCLAYTEGMDQYSFVSSALTYDATLRNLGLIGEAATRLPAYPMRRGLHILTSPGGR